MHKQIPNPLQRARTSPPARKGSNEHNRASLFTKLRNIIKGQIHDLLCAGLHSGIRII